jgi:hypothetical protein
MQEGFAFSHCTTCKAQFHLRPELPEDYSWRQLKFKFFVTRDIFLVFLVLQTVCKSHSYLSWFALPWQVPSIPTINFSSWCPKSAHFFHLGLCAIANNSLLKCSILARFYPQFTLPSYVGVTGSQVIWSMGTKWCQSVLGKIWQPNLVPSAMDSFSPSRF